MDQKGFLSCWHFCYTFLFLEQKEQILLYGISNNFAVGNESKCETDLLEDKF